MASAIRLTFVLKTGLACGICLTVLFCPWECRGQNLAQQAELKAHRAEAPPKLDGVLDDAVWQASPAPIDAWVSYNPLRGAQAEEQTTVWVAYDADAIYFAFRCRDTQPERIRTDDYAAR